MNNSYVSLGSNFKPELHLCYALRRLRELFGALGISPVYRGPAIGFTGEQFLNLVVTFISDHSAEQIYNILRRIESESGRIRGAERFCSRSLDLDLLLHGREIRAEAPELPRSEILRYAFVLRPLAELAPNLQHPILNRSYSALWAEFSDPNQPPLELISMESILAAVY